MSLLLAATGWDAAPWLARFAALLPGRAIVTPETLADPRRACATRSVWRHPPGLLAELPQLEAIFSLGAGVDHILSDPHLPDVPIARVVDPDLTARMSEWVVLHLPDASAPGAPLRPPAARTPVGRRRRPAGRRRRARRHSRPRRTRPRRGAASSPRSAFRVAGWSASAEDDRRGSTASTARPGSTRCWRASDILVCLLPLTAATRGILNASLFAKLPRDGRLGGAILLNAGRGGLQVEADILAALDSRRAQGRLARRVRDRAAAADFAAVGPSGGVRHARTTPRSPTPTPSRAPSPSRSSPMSAASRYGMWWIGAGGIDPSPASGRG